MVIEAYRSHHPLSLPYLLSPSHSLVCSLPLIPLSALSLSYPCLPSPSHNCTRFAHIPLILISFPFRSLPSLSSILFPLILPSLSSILFSLIVCPALDIARRTKGVTEDSLSRCLESLAAAEESVEGARREERHISSVLAEEVVSLIDMQKLSLQVSISVTAFNRSETVQHNRDLQ